MPRWKLGAMIVGTALAAVLLGVTAGTIYGNVKSSMRERVRLKEKQTYLAENIENLSVGDVFPELSFIELSTGSTRSVSEMLPQGGLFIYVAADCPSCYEAVIRLDSAIQEVPTEVRAIAVVVGGNAEELHAYATAQHVRFPLYEDSAQVLIRQYRVFVFPTYFELDRNQTVLRIGADADRLPAFRELITL